MKITYVFSSFMQKKGGAEMSIIEKIGNKYAVFYDNGVWLNLFFFKIRVTNYFIIALLGPWVRYDMKNFNYDFVMVNGIDFMPFINTFHALNISQKKINIYLRSEIELFKFSSRCYDNYFKKGLVICLNYVFRFNRFLITNRLSRIAKDNNVTIIYNSKYMSFLNENIFTNINVLIEEPIRTKHYVPVYNKIKSFHIVGWSKSKGKNIILALASKFPLNNFYIYGAIEERKSSLASNIKFLGRVDNWFDNLGLNDCVLIPSLVPETYSRVCAECINRDLLILASNLGNLKYLLHDEYLINDPCVINNWVLKINKLNEDLVYHK